MRPIILHVILTIVGLLRTTTAAPFTTNISMSICTLAGGCTPTIKRIALDATSNHTSTSGEELIIISKGGDALTLTYGGADVGGPRVYLIEKAGINENYMFMLKNSEFTFDIELSTMKCGFNAALYFVGMNQNRGSAEDGTNYCDAQAIDGTFCSEMDILEANTHAQQYTTHACVDTCGSYNSAANECRGNGSPSTVCDQSGCGLNPFRYVLFLFC